MHYKIREYVLPMQVLHPLLFFLSLLWLTVSVSDSLHVHSAHGHRHRRHQETLRKEGISWIKDLQKRQRAAVKSAGKTDSCLTRDAPKGDSTVVLFKQINKCRVKDPRWSPHLPHGVSRQDLRQTCNPGLYSPEYGNSVPRSEDPGNDAQALSTTDAAQPVLTNPKEKTRALTQMFVGFFLHGLNDSLYSMIVEGLKTQQVNGDIHKPRLYDFYVNDERFVAFLKDIEEGRTPPGRFITLQELERVKALLHAGKNRIELEDEDMALIIRLVFDASVFHTFTLAKAMSRKLNFGIEFNGEMTLQAFAEAVRYYFDTVGFSWGEKEFSSEMLRMFEDVGFFSLAYLQCDGKMTQLDAKYDGRVFKIKLSECFDDEVDVFITSLLNVFNAWGRAPSGITPEVLEQVRAENAEWASQNKGKHLHDCE